MTVSHVKTFTLKGSEYFNIIQLKVNEPYNFNCNLDRL